MLLLRSLACHTMYIDYTHQPEVIYLMALATTALLNAKTAPAIHQQVHFRVPRSGALCLRVCLVKPCLMCVY